MTTQAEKDNIVTLTTAAIAADMAVRQAVLNLTVDAPPVPVPTTGLLSVGSTFQNRRFGWMVDKLDLSKSLPDVPVNCFADAANEIFAHSQNGVQAARFLKINFMGGPGGGLYHMTPIRVGGKVVSWAPHAGNVVTTADPEWQAQSPHSVEGVRGRNVVSPYIVWHNHPTLKADGTKISNSPCTVGVRVDGAVCANYLRGESKILGWVKGAVACTDIALNAAARAIFHVADGQRLVEIDRTPAIDGPRLPDGTEDGTLWAQRIVATATSNITSLACMDDGTLWVSTAVGGLCELVNGALVPVVGFLVPIFSMDPLSDGRLAMLDFASNVYVYDLKTLTSSAQLLQPAPGTAFMSFGTIRVDRFGTFGPKDALYVSRSSGAHNNDLFYIRGPNYATCTNEGAGPAPGNMIPQGESTRGVGDTLYGADIGGHYPWGATPLYDQAGLQVQGFANDLPSMLIPDQRPANFPREAWDHNLWNHGMSVMWAGTVAGMEGTKPSMTCWMNPSGGSLLGAGADNIMEMPGGFDAMAAWIQAGGIGAYPRPEIKGYDMYALLYFFAGQSQRLIREGQPLLDKLAAWAGAVAATSPPNGNAFVEGNIILRANGSAAGIALSATDKFMQPVTPPPGVVARVLLDGQPYTSGVPAAGQHELRVITTTPNCIGEATIWTV